MWKVKQKYGRLRIELSLRGFNTNQERSQRLFYFKIAFASAVRALKTCNFETFSGLSISKNVKIRAKP